MEACAGVPTRYCLVMPFHVLDNRTVAETPYVPRRRRSDEPGCYDSGMSGVLVRRYNRLRDQLEVVSELPGNRTPWRKSLEPAELEALRKAGLISKSVKDKRPIVMVVADLQACRRELSDRIRRVHLLIRDDVPWPSDRPSFFVQAMQPVYLRHA